MNIDVELRDWQRSWREQAVPPTTAQDMARIVRRGTRNALLGTVLAVVFTVAAVAPMLRRAALGEVDPHFLAGILSFVALVWASALWLARGTWRPRDESTAAFIDVSIRRSRAARLGVPVAVVLYGAELLYVLLARNRLDGVPLADLLLSPQFVIVGWIGAPLFVAGQVWYARREQAALERLRRLQATLAGAD